MSGEALKDRVRRRMADVDERYAAARPERAELPATAERRRKWVAEPELNDESVTSATGRGWDDWVDRIEAWDGRDDGHGAIVEFLEKEHEVDSWWAQSITVGYERITGRRLPYQRPDGTFAAGKSRTVAIDADALRELLLDEEQRAGLLPGLQTELRSKPSSKNIRLAIGPGVAQFALEARPDGRTKVTVTHERLPEFDDVEKWRFYWSEWLEAIDEP